MKTLRLMILSLVLSAGQQAVAATLPTQWGVTASTHWADCSFLPSCDTLSFLSGNPINQASEDGGLNQTTASQIDVPQIHDTLIAGTVDMGTASAMVELDTANVSVPILRAAAASNSIEGWVSGLAFTIAGFNYTGPASTINLSATLDGTVTNPNNSDTTGLSVGIWLIRDDGSVTFPNPPPASIGELGAFVFGLPVEDFWVAEDLALGLTDHTVALETTGDDIVSITFTADDILNGNTAFYLMAGLSASATYAGQSALSMSTLTMQFDDTANLVASAAVPLPPAVWMFGAALIGLAGVGRRRS